MLEFLMAAGLFTIPVLLYKIKTHRQGLCIGLFISLFFFGKIAPLLCTAPFGVALFLYYFREKKSKAYLKRPYIVNPSLSMLLLFMLSMTLFCAFKNAFHQYGLYMQLDSKALWISSQSSIISELLGPLLSGRLCDRKGPYHAAVFLTLLAEFSILLASAGSHSLFLFTLGSFLSHLCISGFFVLMPMLAHAYFGPENFFRFYPLMIVLSLAIGASARFQYQAGRLGSANPAGFFLTLILITLTAACFLYAAWKRRFVLVAPIKQAENS